MPDTIRAVTETRGNFVPDARTTLFLMVSDSDGNVADAENVSCSIVRVDDSVVVKTVVPGWSIAGIYAADWDIPHDIVAGKYTATWTYSSDDVDYEEVQPIYISAAGDNAGSELYTARLMDARLALTSMIRCTQYIPVYKEPCNQTKDGRNFSFTFKRWNSGVKILRNDQLVTGGVTIDNFKGKITFDRPLTRYDRVEVSYNFRWFRDEELDRFLSNSSGILNSTPAVTRYNLFNIADRYIPHILYGAAVDAIRSMMLCLQFQQPQLIFGGADRADKVFSNLEGLKKNYEETWNRLLDDKKNGPYPSSRAIITPEFALPGGRSRWFRMLFTSGS